MSSPIAALQDGSAAKGLVSLNAALMFRIRNARAAGISRPQRVAIQEGTSMKVLAVLLGLLGYILIVSNTHLIGLQSLYAGDSDRFAQAAISIGACALFVGIQKLFKSPTALSYFCGLNLTHVAAFLLTTTISLKLLSLELDIVHLIVTILVLAIIEQYIVFAQIASFYGAKKFLFVLVAVYTVFIFGHGLNFDIPDTVSTLFLIPTLFRTIVDRNIWHGVIFHYTYNVAAISGFDRPEVSDAVLLTWLLLMLLYWGLLIFTADNAKPTAAKILSWLFRGKAGATIAALLTVMARLPILLWKGSSEPQRAYVAVKSGIQEAYNARREGRG